ncbi:hypothetical protein [Waltera sp.]|uniref:hypothetical protein n=1 Tax=Waltera sp. TaxID=2815806 RepID=UPI003AF18414
MEQKTINQNKFQTLLCIIALTLGVLVSAVLFSVTPVHAEESVSCFVTSNSGTYDIHGQYTDSKNNICEYDYHCVLDDTSRFYGLVRLPLSSGDIKHNIYFLAAYVIGSNEQARSYHNYNEYPHYFTEHGDYRSDLKYYNCQGLHHYFSSIGTSAYELTSHGTAGLSFFDKASDKITNNSLVHDISFDDFPLPVFESYESMTNYCLTGDKSGVVSEPQLPNNNDESYTFTGFSINGKIARWTGTTERSFAKEVDVEEYVKVSYAWATTTEPDNLGELQSYDGEFLTSDKQLTLPWSEMENGKTDFQFIRQVKIFPCYRVPHLAYYIGQPVTIYYNSDGTVDKIEQTTIPSDSETIGNNISLIGFRYDNSFHAEWVDVWSNGANKSAFDLSGSQYLSLGVKAVYYDGSKSDIDFYSLDRKNLTWNKSFSDFKENNGSPIKSLYFTPYTKTGANNPWNKGNSTVVNFDENGNASSSFDTGDDGTVHLDDFKLTGVVWNKPVVKNGTITWTGTTPNSDLLFVSDSDTLVTATYPRYDADLNTSYETWSTTTIGKGSMKVNLDYLIDYYKNSELAWNGEMWLTPCYKKGGVLYVGDPVIINCLKGTVSDIVVDKDSGKAEQVDKTDQNKSDADSILNVGNQFYSIINGLIGSLQQLPALLTAIFGFLPSSIINLLYASFAVIIICRILGR